MFHWETIHYPTIYDYQAALWPFAVPKWIGALTIHHTYTPTQEQWRGARSMEAMKRYYRDVQHWPSGPHLFLAPDGIWAGTPLAHRGTHAGPCNATAIGLEIVGRFDAHGWDIGLKERVYQLAVLLLHWAGLEERHVNGHRECNSPKTCPGSAISMEIVRMELRDRLFSERFVIDVEAARVRAGTYIQAPILRSVPHGTSLSAHPVRGQAYSGSNRWARVRLPSSAIGYIWAGLGHWERV